MSWKMILSFPFHRWGNKGQISYSKRKLWDWTQVFLTPKLMPFASSIFGIVLSTSYYILCLFLGTSGCFHPSPVQPWLTHWTAAGNLWVTTWDESYEVLPWLAETDAPYKYWEILPYRVRILKLAWKARFANKVPFKKLFTGLQSLGKKWEFVCLHLDLQMFWFEGNYENQWCWDHDGALWVVPAHREILLCFTLSCAVAIYANKCVCSWGLFIIRG